MERPRISRRTFLEILNAASASVLLPGFWPCCNSVERTPNVLIIFADDQRFDTIRALGNPGIITPNLDGLVQRGTSFTNAYIMGGTSGAVCIPSRAMLLCGRSLFQLDGVGGSIPESHIMMPELFRKMGYVTFGTGKWHNGRAAYARSFSHGGEIFFGGMSDHWNVPAYDFDPGGSYAAKTPYIENPALSNEVKYKNYEHITWGKHSSELFSDAAIAFLKEHSGPQPFFLYLSFTAPHDLRSMPEEYREMYDVSSILLPDNFLPEHPFDNGELEVRDEKLAGRPRTREEVRGHIRDYFATITHMDAQIGRVLDALKQTGHDRTTLIVFVGDNGLALGQHGLMGKQSVYDHSVHIPFILCGPGIPEGEIREGLCYHLDLFPTLCDLIGLDVPGSVWGESLVPVLEDEDSVHRESLLFAYKNFQRGIRVGRWKLILYNVRGERHTQLFDLQNDPGESNNLTGDPEHEERIRRLEKVMKVLMKKAGDPVDLDSSAWGEE